MLTNRRARPDFPAHRHFEQQLDASEEEILPAFVEYINNYNGGNNITDFHKGQQKKRTRKRTRRNSSDDEDEEPAQEEALVLYCLCNRVSYGEMIGCDNPSCEIEWFHVGCVGLEEGQPRSGEWYCPTCKKQMESAASSKKRAKPGSSS